MIFFAGYLLLTVYCHSGLHAFTTGTDKSIVAAKKKIAALLKN